MARKGTIEPAGKAVSSAAQMAWPHKTAAMPPHSMLRRSGLSWGAMASENAEETVVPAPRPVVCLVADRDVYERLGPVISYLLVGLIDEPVTPILIGPEVGRRLSFEGPLEAVTFDPSRWLARYRGLSDVVGQIRVRLERLKADGPPIIHALSESTAATAGRMARELSGELIVSLADLDSVYRFGLRPLLERAAAVTVMADRLGKAVEEMGVSCRMLETIRPGVPTLAGVAAFRNRERIPSIVYVGPLIRNSGVEHLIQAFAAVRTSTRDVMLFLIGKGPAESEFRRLAARLGVAEAVTFPGQMEAAVGALGGADILCLPRREAAVSAIVLQAMAMGLVVITGRDGVHDCLIDEQTAWLFNESVADDLERLLHHAVTSQAEAGALAARAQAHIGASHSVGVMVSKYSQLYQRVALPTRTLSMRQSS
jgi:glycosyltransferase involved in cell wall biosynthesis